RPIGARGVLEVPVGVVAVACLDLQVLPLDADLDRPEPAVLRDVGGGVAEQVVRRHVALDALEGRREVVRVEERPAAGVAGERAERVLRRGELAELGPHVRAREELRAAAAGAARRAAGGGRLEAARGGGESRN